MSLARILKVDGLPHPTGLARVVDLSFLVHPVTVAFASVLFLACLVAFVGRRFEVAACTTAAVMLALGTFLQACQWDGDAGANHGTAMPAALLLAYAAAYGLTRDEPLVKRRHGIEAAAGIVAGGYAMAAASKVATTGFGWGLGGNLALHIASHAQVQGGPLLDLRMEVARATGVCTALGVATLFVEGGFVFFLWPRARTVLALLALGLHVSISVVMGLHHYDWLLAVLGVAVASRALNHAAQIR